MTDAPTIVKATAPAELLALLQQLSTEPLRSGIVIAPFAERRSPAVLRHPLPATAAEWKAVASTVMGMISRLRGCDSVAIAICTEEPFDDAIVTYAPLEQMLLCRFLSAGFTVYDTFCVAADGWARFDEAERRDLAEVARIVAAMPPDDEDAPPRLTGALPRTDPSLAARVAVPLLEREDGLRVDAFGRVLADAGSDPIETFERTLGVEVARVGPELLADLILDLQTEGDFDRAVLQVCSGTERAGEVWSSTLATRAEAARRGEQPIELMLRERRRHGRGGSDEVAELLRGLRGARPDSRRVHAAIALLGHVAAHAPREYRPTILCVLAWLHWSLGFGTCAGRLLDESARIFPQHELTTIVNAITLSVMVPSWVLDRDLREATGRTGRRPR